MLNFHKSAQYIDLSEIVNILKAVAIVTGEQLTLSTLFVVRQTLIAKVSPEWRLNPGSGTRKRCPFPLNRCPFNEGNKYKDYVNSGEFSNVDVS